MHHRPSACSIPRASTTKWSCRNMPIRSFTHAGRAWRVMPSGKVTQYDRDEFALLFVSGAGDDREVRVTRYSPAGTRSREQALVELSGTGLPPPFAQPQPTEKSPEASYGSGPTPPC